MDKPQQRTLLSFARETIRAHLAGEPLPPPPTLEAEPEDFGGAFVTLRSAGRLRGCIGQFHPSASLAQTVREMAVAALGDYRFQGNPVTEAELPEITIEVSVLSTMKRTDNPLSLEPGVHGIHIRRGPRAGCFLPQVATEQGWGREEFLSRCCSSKAGLPADAWKDPATQVDLFTADVFGEEHGG